MSTDTDIFEQTFDSFKLMIKLLTFVGFYEIQSSSKYVRICHYIYRVMVLVIIGVYNVQHLMYVVMVRDTDVHALFYGLIIEIPQLNLFVKLATMFVNSQRIQNVHNLIKDPIFAATNKEDEEYIISNNRKMHRLSQFTIFSVSGGIAFWILSFIFARFDDPEAVVPSYMPFDTKSNTGYAMSVLIEISPVIWSGLGHLTADCVIAVYYSQATTQLKIIKHNIQHIFDSEGLNSDTRTERNLSTRRFQYIDEANENIRSRFIYYVERYKKIAWITEEISSIFNRSMSTQFFSTVVASCFVIYNLSTINVISLEFLHLATIIVIYKIQVFLYCFYGHIVEYESQSINTAVYFSDWLSVSPRFRREILFAMTRWGKPLTPRVSLIIPVSLLTFAKIVKSAYTLYTVMKSNQLSIL